MNRELLRFAFNQSEGRLSREEVHDIVERCDGTVAGVTILLEARMSDFIILKPSQRATRATPNSLSALTPSTNPSGSSSTNHFRLLSDTADEEDACMKNDSASPPACCPGCGKGLFLGEQCCVVIQEEEYHHDDHSSDEESDGDVDEYGGDFLRYAHRYPLNVSHLAVAVDDSAGNTTTQSEAVEGTSTYTSFFVNIRPF